MKLEQQVCSLELAKQLKELGVKQESLFRWYQPGGLHGDEWVLIYDTDGQGRRITSFDDGFSAFTVAEIGEMLPEYKTGYKAIRTYWDLKNGCGAELSLPGKYYQDDENSRHATTHYSDTEANARAKMLIYLLENKITTLL